METIDSLFAEPSTHPEDSVSGFVSRLLEEFGDEWGNKWMFHLRWAREEDRLSAGGRIAAMMAPKGNEEARLAARTQIIERMQGRVWFVGSNDQTAPQIEAGFRAALELLDAHLANRAYLFGGRPSFGDFGLWAQIYNAWTDPTAAAWIESSAPAVLDWIHRMLWPTREADFESWSNLEPTLAPFLATQVGALFCPWTAANDAAIAAGEEQFSVELASGTWTQKPQKYHAKSLRAIRSQYAAVRDKSELDAVLEAAGCLATLRAGQS
jgi:glutathione S-transferase